MALRTHAYWDCCTVAFCRWLGSVNKQGQLVARELPTVLAHEKGA